MSLKSRLTPFFTARFLKFATVGASGVIVNLGFFWIFIHCGLHQNLASALAIEVSILSNFLCNEFWTFRDQHSGSRLSRLLRFQIVSIVGACAQWLTFVICNWLWFALLNGFDAFQAEFDQGLVNLFRKPPEIGHFVYASQIIGIGVSTVWNFLANFYWTWRKAAK